MRFLIILCYKFLKILLVINMLSSSQEYIQALRDGQYRLFLNWVKFLSDKYMEGKDNLNSDEALNLIIFEWLNNGFCEEDAKRIAFLCAIHFAQPFPGILSYTLTAICGAVVHLMVYLQHKDRYLTTKELSKSEIDALLNLELQLDKLAYEQKIDAAQKQFETWVEEADKDSAEQFGIQIHSQLEPLTEIINLVEDYARLLEKADLAADPLKPTRLSIIYRLKTYLSEQIELSPEIIEKINEYGSEIRAKNPDDLEEPFLKVLAPLSFWDKVFLKAIEIGGSTFLFFQPADASVSVSSNAPRSSPKNS